MKTLHINMLLKVCLTCATEKKIKTGKEWTSVNNCPLCNTFQPLFNVVGNISKDQALADSGGMEDE